MAITTKGRSEELEEKKKKIIPCGIKDKGVTNLISIAKNDYSNLDNLLIEKFISNLKI